MKTNYRKAYRLSRIVMASGIAALVLAVIVFSAAYDVICGSAAEILIIAFGAAGLCAYFVGLIIGLLWYRCPKCRVYLGASSAANYRSRCPSCKYPVWEKRHSR